VNRGYFLQLCCAQQEVEEERGRPFGDSPTSLRPSRPVYSARPIYATWLFCSVDGEAVRRVMRLAFAHTCPHQMPMRGATATTTKAKATAYRIVSSPCVTSAVLEGPSRNGEDQNMCGPAPVITAGCYLYYRRGGSLSLFHLCIFRERSRYLHDTFVLSPTRRSPGLERLCNHGHPQTLSIHTMRCERMEEERISQRCGARGLQRSKASTGRQCN